MLTILLILIVSTDMETLIISKGFHTPLYWFRTRSNPHRDNYH